jgi:hypothetical protein
MSLWYISTRKGKYKKQTLEASRGWGKDRKDRGFAGMVGMGPRLRGGKEPKLGVGLRGKGGGEGSGSGATW